MTKEEVIAEMQRQVIPSFKKLIFMIASGELDIKDSVEKSLCARHEGMETFIKNQNIIANAVNNNVKAKRNININSDILRYCEADVYSTLSMMNMLHDMNNEHKHEESENIFNEVLEQMGE